MEAELFIPLGFKEGSKAEQLSSSESLNPGHVFPVPNNFVRLTYTFL